MGRNRKMLFVGAITRGHGIAVGDTGCESTIVQGHYMATWKAKVHIGKSGDGGRSIPARFNGSLSEEAKASERGMTSSSSAQGRKHGQKDTLIKDTMSDWSFSTRHPDHWLPRFITVIVIFPIRSSCSPRIGSP